MASEESFSRELLFKKELFLGLILYSLLGMDSKQTRT